SIKHSVIASVVSSSVTMPTPSSSNGSSGSNSSLGINLLKTLAGGAASRGKPTGKVFFHRIVLRVGRQAVGARLPRAAPTEAAILRLGDADQTFFGHGIDGVIVCLAPEDESHEGFGLVEQGVGLVHRHV